MPYTSCENMIRFLVRASFAFIALSVSFAQPVLAQQQRPLKIGLVTFLSGPAAATFGKASRGGAETLVAGLNAGRVPAPYTQRGFGGVPLQLVVIDEAGASTKQVTEYRNLVQKQQVDFVVGYISSANCLAVAPVAEELQRLTIFFDCGSPRLFEENTYKYVFRTRATMVMDAVGAAMYLAETRPDLKTVAGINQNYAYGQDSWRDFEAALKVLRPQVEIVGSHMPRFGAGQYGAEISALAQARPQVIHSSFWGSDLDSFLVQAGPRGLLRNSQLVLVAAEPHLDRMAGILPDGTILGARGPVGVFVPDNALSRWFKAAYRTRVGGDAPYVAYSPVLAILGLKAAYEKAQARNGGKRPSQDQIMAALKGSSFETPAGRVDMARANGHQAIQGTVYGTTKTVNGKITMIDVKHYPAEVVQPPEGMTSGDWIKSGMKPSK